MSVEAEIKSFIGLKRCEMNAPGLFEDNKLTCSFLIATALQRHDGEITPTEWSLLLRPGFM